MLLLSGAFELCSAAKCYRKYQTLSICANISGPKIDCLILYHYHDLSMEKIKFRGGSLIDLILKIHIEVCLDVCFTACN